MTTQEMLFEQFGRRALVPIEEVGELLCGVDGRSIVSYLNTGKLWLPAIKFHDSRQAPVLVPISALAVYIDSLAEKEVADWEKMSGGSRK